MQTNYLTESGVVKEKGTGVVNICSLLFWRDLSILLQNIDIFQRYVDSISAFIKATVLCSGSQFGLHFLTFVKVDLSESACDIRMFLAGISYLVKPQIRLYYPDFFKKL